MKDEATPEQLTMARKIVAGLCSNSAAGREAAELCLRGYCDDALDVKAALAAIIETQRLDAEALEHLASTASCGCRPCHGHVEREATYTECIEAIRSGAHLKGQDHG